MERQRWPLKERRRVEMICVQSPMDIIEKHASSIPVPVFDILRDSGLSLIRLPLAYDIAGWITKNPHGELTAFVNSTHSRERQRFTAAHQLGHFIYHRDLLGNGVRSE